ncbi:MAG: hypothetical protein HY774_06825 [Acidobacteria bacterium]|nr:hypothetical protein [Acidobacteriota bacterium]
MHLPIQSKPVNRQFVPGTAFIGDTATGIRPSGYTEATAYIGKSAPSPCPRDWTSSDTSEGCSEGACSQAQTKAINLLNKRLDTNPDKRYADCKQYVYAKTACTKHDC